MKLYLGKSKIMSKRWVVLADSVKGATAKSIEKYLSLLNEMDSVTSEDINVDFRFSEVTEDMLEINYE